MPAATQQASNATPTPPRVWVVLDLRPKKRGSLEQGLVALATRLHALGVETTFVFSTPPVDWLQAALDERAVAVRVLDFRRPLAAWSCFHRWLEAGGAPDLVHFHFVRAHSPLVLLAHAAGACVLVHDHVTLGQPTIPGAARAGLTRRLLRPLKRLRARALARCVDRRLAVSQYVAASAAEADHFPPERIEVVPNGVDVSRFVTAEPMALRWELGIGGRPLVGCVSRLAPAKGVDTLIRALSHLHDDSALVLAGDGPDGERCRRLAETLGIADRVHFLGLRDDVEKVYAASDVVVVPSQWNEAFGLSVVEAMAAARPVIVTDSGAMPEIVARGECGVVVPRHDEAALADAIRALFADRARASAIGLRARRRAIEVYPIERWVDELVAAYGRMLPRLAELDQLIPFVDAEPARPLRPLPEDATRSASA